MDLSAELSRRRAAVIQAAVHLEAQTASRAGSFTLMLAQDHLDRCLERWADQRTDEMRERWASS